MLAGAGAPSQSNQAADQITFEQEFAWSPDARRIAFSAMAISRSRWAREKYGALRDGQYDVFVVGADGSGLQRLTDNPGYDLWLAWSPDGARLLFSSTRDGNTDLYVMTVAHGELVRLTSDPAEESAPSWSRDGSRIAFMAKREGKWRLFVMNADGSNRRQLTTGSGNDANPVWSPDGARIVFSAEQGVFAINTDGSGRTRLVDKAHYARWSPDGQRLAFVAGEFPDTRIYVAGPDGSHPMPITP